jgi:DNA-binding response OmpR family regulator
MGLRNEESFGRIESQMILLLLDRSADVFIADRAGADGWLIKPLNSLRLRKAVQQILSGSSYTEGNAEPLTTDPVTI